MDVVKCYNFLIIYINKMVNKDVLCKIGFEFVNMLWNGMIWWCGYYVIIFLMLLFLV